MMERYDLEAVPNDDLLSMYIEEANNHNGRESMLIENELLSRGLLTRA